MNSWQLLRQIQYLLRQATWDGSAKVWAPSSVVVTEYAEDEAIKERIAPLAMISVGGGVADPEFRDEPRLRRREVRVALVAVNELDSLGESSLLGGARPPGETWSGRGLLELEEQLDLAISRLTKANGVRIALAASSMLDARRHPTLGYIVQCEYSFEAWVAVARVYEPVAWMTSSVLGGSVTLTWKLPGRRFDTLRAKLIRKSGSSAPSSPADGTNVALSGDFAESKTDAPAAGTYTYGLFVAYDETGGGSEEQYSAPVSRTVTV